MIRTEAMAGDQSGARSSKKDRRLEQTYKRNLQAVRLTEVLDVALTMQTNFDDLLNTSHCDAMLLFK